MNSAIICLCLILVRLVHAFHSVAHEQLRYARIISRGKKRTYKDNDDDRPPLSPSKGPVPCLGAVPLMKGQYFFIGEKVWNILTSQYGSDDTGLFLRAAELKHGRVAMLATVGYAVHKLGLTVDQISPHEFLSYSQGIRFADLARLNPLEAIQAVPAGGLYQIFFLIAAIELYELTHVQGAFRWDERVAPGLQSGGLTGDLGFNPLKINVTNRRRLVELQNGRAAMFAICAWVSAEAFPGSVPLLLPW